MKKLIAFDLDGTLTQHKSPLGEKNRQALENLSKRYKLLMLGAGACRRIYDQMQGFPIEIVGNYGLQRSVIENGEFKLVAENRYEVDKEAVENAVTALRDKYNLYPYSGDNVEFHASGLITFPILGTKAKIEDKLAYDPDRKKRRVMYEDVKKAFEGYNVFIGGSSSYDITKGDYNKFHALKKYCDENGYDLSEVLFFGDDFEGGGNDSHVMLGGVDCVVIDDYTTFAEKAQFLLD